MTERNGTLIMVPLPQTIITNPKDMFLTFEYFDETHTVTSNGKCASVIGKGSIEIKSRIIV